MKRRIQVVCAFHAMLLGIGVSGLRAQATASVTGTVTDATGAIVAEAVVRATNEGTAIVRGTISDTEGRFRIPDLAIGQYSIEAQKPGFATVIHKGVTLTVGSSPVVDFALPVGQTQYAKVAPVQGEHGLNLFPVSQVHQRRVGKLNSQTLVLSENCGNFREIRLAE